MTFTPTAEQQAIIDKSKTGASFVVTALAGTGKTTTLKRVCLESPERNYLYVAFNNKVAKDFRDWAAKEGITNVRAMTGDAIGRAYVHNTRYAPYGLDIGKRIGDGLTRGKEIYKVFKFKDQTLKEYPDPKAEKKEEIVRLSGAELVNYVKDAVNNFCISTDEMILPKHFDTYEPNDDVIRYAIQLWEDYNNEQFGKLRLPFQVIFKIFALDAPSMQKPYDPRDHYHFDALLIDEAQDTNPVAGKQYMAQEAMQIIYVGDPNQAIYGFRGAEDEMQKRSDLEVLPLTESWRFGSNIAEFANQALAKMNSATYLQGNAPDPGNVFISTYEQSLEDIDAIVQRTNSGCLTSIFALLHLGIRPMVDDKTKAEIVSLVETLAYLAGQSSKPTKIDSELEDYETLAEVKKAIEQRKLPNRIKILLDMVEDEKQGGSKGILETIKPVSNRGKYGVRIITTHRAKGDEWDNVLLGNDFFTPRWDFKEDKVIMPAKSEMMLIYVAATRAMKSLRYPRSLEFVRMSMSEIADDLQNRYRRSNEERDC